MSCVVQFSCPKCRSNLCFPNCVYEGETVTMDDDDAESNNESEINSEDSSESEINREDLSESRSVDDNNDVDSSASRMTTTTTAAAATTTNEGDFYENVIQYMFRPTTIEKDFMGRPSVLPDWAYQNIACSELDFIQPPLVFRGNLGVAEMYLKLFLQKEAKTTWYHLLVGADVLETFVQRVQSMDTLHILPFWCWCDGRNRHHRHMILIALDGALFMNKCWRRIPSKNILKLAKRIRDWFHLVNVMHYVSNKHTIEDDVDGGGGGDSHFYIHLGLPECAKLALSLVVNYASYHRLLSEEHGNRSQIGGELKRVNNRWRVRVGDWVKPQQRRLVLPVRKCLRPIGVSDSYPPTEQQQHFLYLGKWKVLVFREDPDLERLSDRDWIDLQLDGGNCFYDVVADDLWPLTRNQQKIQNVVQPLLRVIQEKDSVIDRLTQELDCEITHCEELESTIYNLRFVMRVNGVSEEDF